MTATATATTPANPEALSIPGNGLPVTGTATITTAVADLGFPADRPPAYLETVSAERARAAVLTRYRRAAA